MQCRTRNFTFLDPSDNNQPYSRLPQLTVQLQGEVVVYERLKKKQCVELRLVVSNKVRQS